MFLLPGGSPPPSSSGPEVKVSARITTLVSFSWGSSTAKYARYDSDIVIGPDTYQSLPTLDVDYAEQHGGSQDTPITVTLPVSSNPCPLLVGQRVGAVEVSVYECEPDDPAGTVKQTFRGWVSVPSANPVSKIGVMKLTVVGLKARLDVSLGIIIGEKCPWPFGGPICGKDLTPLKVSGLISSIQGSRVVCASTAGITDVLLDGYWRNGWITVDGYSVKILDWIQPDVFIMGRSVPRAWSGATGLFTPGCSKLIGQNSSEVGSCRFWGRESRFGGFGTLMPNRNPQLSAGDS